MYDKNEAILYGGSHTVSTGVRFYSVRFYYARMSSVHSVSAIIIPWCVRDSARTLGIHVAATDIASLDGNMGRQLCRCGWRKWRALRRRLSNRRISP